MATVQPLGLFSRLPLTVQTRLIECDWNRSQIPTITPENDDNKRGEYPTNYHLVDGTIYFKVMWIRQNSSPEESAILNVSYIGNQFKNFGSEKSINSYVIQELYSFYFKDNKFTQAIYREKSWKENHFFRRTSPQNYDTEEEAMKLFFYLFPKPCTCSCTIL